VARCDTTVVEVKSRPIAVELEPPPPLAPTYALGLGHAVAHGEIIRRVEEEARFRAISRGRDAAGFLSDGPNEQTLMDRTIFLMGQNFPDGKKRLPSPDWLKRTRLRMTSNQRTAWNMMKTRDGGRHWRVERPTRLFICSSVRFFEVASRMHPCGQVRKNSTAGALKTSGRQLRKHKENDLLKHISPICHLPSPQNHNTIPNPNDTKLLVALFVSLKSFHGFI
jgi:hypothetical protein